jgi:hypothetical protein
MRENSHMAVITCDECGKRSEFELFHVVDSKTNLYEKQQILNGAFFDYKCPNCQATSMLSYETVYVDSEKNFEIYLVHESHLEGAHTMLHQVDAINNIHMPENDPWFSVTRKIVTCPHLLREKVMILDAGYDDRVVEIAKILCIEHAEMSVPDLRPIGADFEIRDGKPYVNVMGEEKMVRSPLPMELYNDIARDFIEVLEEDDPFVVDETWALSVLEDIGVDLGYWELPDDYDDDFDDNDDYFEDANDCRCPDCTCEGDCNNCPCGEGCDENCNGCKYNCLDRERDEDGPKNED